MSSPDFQAPPSACTSARLFTVADADRSLVLVRRIVEDIVVRYRGVLDYQEILEASLVQGSTEQADQARRDLERCMDKLQACAEELLGVGVELKDWSAGVVDYPATFEGRPICLCWQHGEPVVGHWHEVGAACGTRQEIETLLAQPQAN